MATALILAALWLGAGMRFENLLSLRVASNLLGSNAVIGIAAVGMTFVLLSGGIDLSVGSVVAFTSIFIASQIRGGMPAPAAMAAALAIGTVFGALQGLMIQGYRLPAFLVTLGGMFLMRGLAFTVSEESIAITSPLHSELQERGLPLAAGVQLPFIALLFLAVIALGALVAHGTRFGRNVYALGGSEPSAMLMGLPVGRIRVAVYALSGFCAALAGVALTIQSGAGNATNSQGLELEAISAAVIGGTLLTGGRGYVVGTLLGVLVAGLIRTIINFAGNIPAAWQSIAVGGLLLAFILLQKLIAQRAPV
jgi:simple sugar transport system permease protein